MVGTDKSHPCEKERSPAVEQGDSNSAGAWTIIRDHNRRKARWVSLSIEKE